MRMLDLQADKIEMVLASHRVAGRVWGGTIAPRFVTFEVTPAWGTRVRQIFGLSEEIAMALGVPRCRLYREDGAIRVEIPRQGASSVSLVGLCSRVGRLPQATAVLGVDKSGRTLMVRLPSPDVVHILVSGTTGSGKTEALRAIVGSLAYLNRQSECQMLLIDPKRRGLAPFAGLPHLICSPISSVGDAVEALREAVGWMEARDEQGIEQPKIIVVIDELADLLMVGGNEVESSLIRLAQRGRGAGIHLVAATQKPSASVISSVLRSNFPLRLVGRVVSAQDALAAAGIGGSGAEKLMGRGDMLAVAQGQTTRFQGAFSTEAELRRLVQWATARERSGAGVARPMALPEPARA